jgi:hypothetical protein
VWLRGLIVAADDAARACGDAAMEGKRPNKFNEG